MECLNRTGNADYCHVVRVAEWINRVAVDSEKYIFLKTISYTEYLDKTFMEEISVHPSNM